MTITHPIAILTCLAVGLPASQALAEDCNGYVVSKSMPPIVMRNAEDGSKVVWGTSEGLFIVLNPANHPANLVNRVCAGGMQIAADGKSGSAVGSCTYTDKEGDVFHLNWQSGLTEGTWQIVKGSGKFENMSGSGMFWPSSPYDNKWGSSTWEGDCSFD